MRLRAGLTQKNCARLIGVSANTFFRWESGASVPRGVSCAALVRLSKLSPKDAREKSRIQRMSGKFARTLQDDLHVAPNLSTSSVTPRGSLQWDANRIVRLRLRLRITQEHFADKLGVSTSAVQKWESGLSVPTGLSFEAVKALEAMLPPDDGGEIPGFKKVPVRSKFFDASPLLPILCPGMHPRSIVRKAKRPRPFRAYWEKVSASPLTFLVFVPPRAGKHATRGDYANVEHDASYCYTQVELIRKVRRTKGGDFWEYNRLFRKKT